MKIKSIKIEKLFGKYDLQRNLREGVNIIVGDNGSYKSTLLSILASMCEPENIPDDFDVKGVTMCLTDNILIKFRCFKDSLLRLTKDAADDHQLSELVTKIMSDIAGKDENRLSDYTLNASIITITKGDKTLPINQYRKLRKYSILSTFDVPACSDKGTILDQQLEKLEREYAYYLSDLSKQITTCIQQNGFANRKDLEDIHAHHHTFIGRINRAFANTNKTVDTTQSKLQFKLGEDLLESNKRLSAGEKQFLIVMLTVLLQRKEESILIMDEPEISMHLDWQRTLIVNILTLNPNCQLIIATHSPGIMMDGWEQCVTNMSSFITHHGK